MKHFLKSDETFLSKIQTTEAFPVETIFIGQWNICLHVLQHRPIFWKKSDVRFIALSAAASLATCHGWMPYRPVLGGVTEGREESVSHWWVGLIGQLNRLDQVKAPRQQNHFPKQPREANCTGFNNLEIKISGTVIQNYFKIPYIVGQMEYELDWTYSCLRESKWTYYIGSNNLKPKKKYPLCHECSPSSFRGAS